MNTYQEEIDNLALECMALAMLIHRKTEYCVFIDFSGHVESLEIKIKQNKKKYNQEFVSCELRLAPWDHETQIDIDYRLLDIKEKRDTLKKIAIDGGINTDYMDKIVHKTYSYVF